MAYLVLDQKWREMSKKVYYYLNEIEKSIRGEPIMPVTCEIDLSNKCQLDCNFCMYKHFRKSNSMFLDWILYIRLIKSLVSIGAKSVTFTGGGEPTMYPYFNKATDIARLAGLELGLITNGVNLSKIQDLSIFKFVRVSLDAATSETYEKIKGKNLFGKVVINIGEAVRDGAPIGISFVVSKENKHEITKAKKLAKQLGVRYIQFKPVWINGKVFTDYEVEEDVLTLSNIRSIAVDQLPCDIAGLVGIVSATADVYFCCQHRGDPNYVLGNLNDDSFGIIWAKRVQVKPDISACPMCRYMEYAEAYKQLIEEGTMFFDHKHFL